MSDYLWVWMAKPIGEFMGALAFIAVILALFGVAIGVAWVYSKAKAWRSK